MICLLFLKYLSFEYCLIILKFVDAAWARAGFLKYEDLDTLRSITSKIEGHPTPDQPFVDVATGSLG